MRSTSQGSPAGALRSTLVMASRLFPVRCGLRGRFPALPCYLARKQRRWEAKRVGFSKRHPSAAKNERPAWRLFVCPMAFLLAVLPGLGACSSDMQPEPDPAVIATGSEAAKPVPKQVLSDLPNDVVATSDKRVALCSGSSLKRENGCHHP